MAENGYTFVSFEPLENNSYDLRYQDMKNSTYDYIEAVSYTHLDVYKRQRLMFFLFLGNLVPVFFFYLR